MVSFLYLPIVEQLQTLCKSQTFCHDFLAMWRARERWLNKSPLLEDIKVDEFWDGEKLRSYHDFWNPTATY